MSTIKFIASHHAGGLAEDKFAKTQHLPWEHINEAHRERWNFKSSLGYYGGYNFYFQADGTRKQFRAIGEETAAQLGHNFDTLSYCCAGNFVELNGVRIESPTEAQKKAVVKFLDQLYRKDYTDIAIIPGTVIELSASSLNPHRFYSQTECDCLPNAFWRDEFAKASIPIDPASPPSPQATFDLIDSIIKLLLQLEGHLRVILAEKKTGAVDRAGCGGL